MIIDTHAHIFSAAGPFMPGARYCPNYDAKIEDWLALWPPAGVTHGVLVQPSFLGTDNSLLLGALEQRPELLRGVIVIDSSVGKAQLQQWNRTGARGVRLNLIGIGDLSVFGGPQWSKIFRWMVELGWHLEVQCEGERLAALLSVLPDIPLALVIDHFGLPDPHAAGYCPGILALFQETRRRKVFVKLSAPYRLRGVNPGKYAELYLKELGPEFLLWGTDWPWTNHESGRSYTECQGMLRTWIPSPDSEDMVLGGAPRALYRFGE
ncbi:amidohydrolase family protein [Noviherbaspirillum aerium]|uniref:amidohydrolase family protein n=1 Tax=Noviherbaspirillum aerium TaxID=2588497 RepID=UPI00124E1210|nr:amidohydrolase family protein [Noviherbaspirillum aerium]